LIAPLTGINTYACHENPWGDPDRVEHEFNDFPLVQTFKTPGFEEKNEAAGKNISLDCPKV
jgi:hypothetical protein